MFATIMNAVAGQGGHGKLKSIFITGAMLAGLGLPTAAFADHHDRHDRHGFHVDVDIPLPRIFVPAGPCPAPVVVTQSNQVWVPAVYQTVTEKVWVPDVTTTQLQRMEIPAEYGNRDVLRVGFFGPRVRHERYLISPAHCENRQVNVVLTPAHFEVQTQQQLISEGHWETQVYQAPVTVVIPGN
jgi:hypothetical protein